MCCRCACRLRRLSSWAQRTRPSIFPKLSAVLPLWLQAEEAEQLGLVDMVVPKPRDLQGAACSMALEIAGAALGKHGFQGTQACGGAMQHRTQPRTC